ncbi:tubulin polyglutamylase complex subunit 2-like [Photinus pyralis]|nr:tubulin polyglutamylase complex subunit 2-like [Photinus pyralis]
MPEDLRAFYTSSNGFIFEWTYTLTGDCHKDKVSGAIKINPLQHLVPIFGFETSQDPGVKLDTERYQIKLSIESRLFIIDTVPDRGHVVLVYLFPKYVPTIWLLTSNMTLHFLANDIATYLRMAVSHLGIPNWQMIYTPNGVPQWTENLFRMLAPHLLPLSKTIESTNREQEEEKNDNCSEVPINKLDPNLFKLLPRTAIPVLIRSVTSPQPEKTATRKKAYKQADQTHKPRTRMLRKPLYYVKKNSK